MHLIFSVIFFLLVQNPEHELKLSKQDVLHKINEIRSSGCKCGRNIMPPVGPVIWSERLEDSARRHAKDMKKHNYFSHYSRKGKSVGDRLDALGYDWLHIGENIASGQVTFNQVLEDWLSSESHCEMIMNKNMEEMGISRVGDYWVQHFGTQRSR